MEDTLYQRLIAGGVSADSMSNHESDLYVPVTQMSTAIIKSYFEELDVEYCAGETAPRRGFWRQAPYKTPMPEQFKSLVDGVRMYDIPFRFDPWWAKRLAASPKVDDKPAIVAEIPQLPAKKAWEITHEGYRLSGGYLFIPTYADLTDEEFAVTKDWDETPLAYLGVERNFFLKFIADRYESEKEFFSEYTYDDISDLEGAATLADALAFSYRPALDKKFDLPEFCRDDAMIALVDFLSGKLQEAEHNEAAAYLDSVMQKESRSEHASPMLERVGMLSQTLQNNGYEDASKYIDALFDL